jgi:hypothetical protein
VGDLRDGALHVGAQRLVTVDQGHVHRHGLLPAAVLDAREEAAAVRGRGAAAHGCAAGRLAGGLVEMRRPLGPFGPEVIAAAQELTGGAPPARVDGGVGEESATQQHGDLVGLEAVVLGLAPVQGPPVERVCAPEGKPRGRAPVGAPGPR